jgi:hypothetical protein
LNTDGTPMFVFNEECPVHAAGATEAQRRNRLRDFHKRGEAIISIGRWTRMVEGAPTTELHDLFRSELAALYEKHGPWLVRAYVAGDRLYDYAAHAAICTYGGGRPCDCGLQKALEEWDAIGGPV